MKMKTAKILLITALCMFAYTVILISCSNLEQEQKAEPVRDSITIQADSIRAALNDTLQKD